MNRKQLLNQDLTNSVLFQDYDQVIESYLYRIIAPFYSGPEDPTIPDLEVFDLTYYFPLHDPGNEQVFAIRIRCNEELLDHLQQTQVQDMIRLYLSAAMSSDGDYAACCDAILVTNSDAFILFTYCK